MKLRILALAGVATLALAGTASAGTGWYLGLGGGWSMHNDTDFSVGAFTGDTKFKNAGDFMLNSGYKWDNGLRFEVEGNYAQYGGKSLRQAAPPGVFPMTGHIAETALLANLAYDIGLSDQWALEVGGGAGWGWSKAKLALPGNTISGTDGAFAYQLMGGINWAIASNLDLGLDYRWLSIGATDHVKVPPLVPQFRFDKKDSQTVMLSLRWFLEEEAPPPPVPAPVPPPAPLPPPPVKTFVVFFDFNKSNLTAEAQGVVTEAVAAAKANGWVKVVVTGHTDTVGSDSYNQALSERRATSVKDEMVRQGMSAGDIATEGKSFHDPLVPTGPGVREPQNRRAVIAF